MRGENNKVSVLLKLKFSFQFRVPRFGALYFYNQAELDFGTLSKLEISRNSTTLVTTSCTKTKRIRSYEVTKIKISVYFLGGIAIFTVELELGRPCSGTAGCMVPSLTLAACMAASSPPCRVQVKESGALYSLSRSLAPLILALCLALTLVLAMVAY